MRKFTKEISALLATVAVGTSVNAATAASENEAVKTEGVAMISDTELEQMTTMVGTTVAEPITTQYEDTYFEGEMMPPVTEPIYTVGTEIGTTTTTTTDKWGGTSMIGTQITPYTTTTTTAETTYLAGTWTADYTTTTEDTWIAGGIMDIHYGDANADGKLSVSDSVAILQFIANKDKYSMSRSAQASADCYNPGDGVTPMDALTINRVDAGELTEYDLPVYPDCNSGNC